MARDPASADPPRHPPTHLAAPPPPALLLRGLRYRWPGAAADTLALDELHIARGETVFLRGPSGCGKSTLLGVAAGVLLPHRGEAALLGQPWSALSAAARDRFRADHVGTIFQQFNLLPYLSVLDNVRLPCRFSRRRQQQAPPRAAEALLASTGLPERLWSAPAGELSVGQQQRVAAARALIGTPEVVIADEPTSALDEDLREAFMALLLGACAAAGSALLFVSHDARLAERFARRIDLPTLNHAAGVAP